MARAVRNHGRSGIAACAIAAVDIALWDLKARLLDVSVSELLGAARDAVPVYASGGFTSTPLPALEREVAGYVADGYRRIKIKIGQPVASALERARLACEVAGDDVQVMVDGNGAFSRKEAARLADALGALGVHYFEEPVSSDDTEGLRLLRDRSSLDIAAGEYSYLPVDNLRLLAGGAVDVLQADATRCLGFSGFLQADALCDAFEVPLSAHCAPALHAHVGRAARRLVHVEHFFDHVRFERMLFEDVPTLRAGSLTWDWSRPGLGLEMRPRNASSATSAKCRASRPVP
jgi:L-alanine-DL-glutamate epimerase-like enolase superfamily enzyme